MRVRFEHRRVIRLQRIGHLVRVSFRGPPAMPETQDVCRNRDGGSADQRVPQPREDQRFISALRDHLDVEQEQQENRRDHRSSEHTARHAPRQ